MRPITQRATIRIMLLLCLLLTASGAAANAKAGDDKAPITPAANPAVDYDIVYVRQPRRGDNEHIIWPEVFHPGRVEAGADLMLLHPDGSEETLVDATDGAVTDPFVAFDGQWVYYAYFPDVRPAQSNDQRGDLPYAGSDIYRIHIATRQVERLTHQEFTPNTGAGNWDESNPIDPPDNFNRLGYGILNLGPAPLAGGKIVFTSNRNGFVPTKGYTFPTLQLFVMDADGSNVTLIAPMTIGSSLHPTPLQDGRILFSSYESQGLRDSRLWGIWAIQPDGRYWEPVVSAFKGPDAFHFQTQLGNGDIVVEDYYNLNNFGFGALYRLPLAAPAGEPAFFSAFLSENPPISQTLVFQNGPQIYPRRMGFTPRGLTSLSLFTNAEDEAAPLINGAYVGKFTHPSAAPNNDLLVAYSAGPVNALNRPVNLPAPDAGLYLIPGGNPVSSPSALVLIKNDPAYNEVWPRALVSYQTVHGVAEPTVLPWLPNNGTAHAALPAGTAYGLVGASSFYKRESFPGYASNQAFDGLEEFNTAQNDSNSNWFTQGADAGKYSNADIWAVRLLAMEPNTHRSYGPHLGQHFFNHINEKLRILGEIPLRKVDAQGNPLLDPEGNPDTSFLVKIPADTPFTFQMIDRNGLTLAMSQTWHQVRPGEVRADCGGCHAHSQQPLPFAQTAAASSNYVVTDLSKVTPLLTHAADGTPTLRRVAGGVVNVEFFQDIRPLLQRSCVQCHTQTSTNPPGNLVLNDVALYDVAVNSGMQVPGDYARLCQDAEARWGYPPLVKLGNDPVWRGNNASRYVRLLQSRRSLLIWKIFGTRLDGWTNEDHPTERVPGDATTLPAGANSNYADLDYTGTIMPPPGSAVPPLSVDEKMTVARWVDLGCPINVDQGTADEEYGWFVDDLRPTLTVSLPRPGVNSEPLVELRVGVADANSGVASETLTISATVPLAGRAAGAPLADLAQLVGDGLYTLALEPPITSLTAAHLLVTVQDKQGNITRVDRKFSVAAAGVATATATATQPVATSTATAPVTTIPTVTPTAIGTGTPQKLFLPAVER